MPGSVCKGQGQDAAIIKIIDVAGISSGVVSGHRVGIGLVDVTEAAAGNQRAQAGGNDDIVGEQWSILETEAEIPAELASHFIGQ